MQRHKEANNSTLSLMKMLLHRIFHERNALDHSLWLDPRDLKHDYAHFP